MEPVLGEDAVVALARVVRGARRDVRRVRRGERQVVDARAGGRLLERRRRRGRRRLAQAVPILGRGRGRRGGGVVRLAGGVLLSAAQRPRDARLLRARVRGGRKVGLVHGQLHVQHPAARRRLPVPRHGGGGLDAERQPDHELLAAGHDGPHGERARGDLPRRERIPLRAAVARQRQAHHEVPRSVGVRGDRVEALARAARQQHDGPRVVGGAVWRPHERSPPHRRVPELRVRRGAQRHLRRRGLSRAVHVAGRRLGDLGRFLRRVAHVLGALLRVALVLHARQLVLAVQRQLVLLLDVGQRELADEVALGARLVVDALGEDGRIHDAVDDDARGPLVVGAAAGRADAHRHAHALDLVALVVEALRRLGRADGRGRAHVDEVLLRRARAGLPDAAALGRLLRARRLEHEARRRHDADAVLGRRPRRAAGAEHAPAGQLELVAGARRPRHAFRRAGGGGRLALLGLFPELADLVVGALAAQSRLHELGEGLGVARLQLRQLLDGRVGFLRVHARRVARDGRRGGERRRRGRELRLGRRRCRRGAAIDDQRRPRRRVAQKRRRRRPALWLWHWSSIL